MVGPNHNRWRSPVPVRAAFVPAVGVGEGRRGASDEKPRGTRFLRSAGPSAEPVRDIFAPAGRSRSTPNTNGIIAAPTRRRVVENRQRCPQGRRPDTLTGGAGRAHDPRTRSCVCVSTVRKYCIRPTNRRRRYYYYYYYRKYNNIIFTYILYYNNIIV